MKVYRWQSFWNDPRIKGTHRQVECVCAAKSQAEIMRTYGYRKSDLFNLGETGNKESIAVAIEAPLTVFARALSVYGEPFLVMKTPAPPEAPSEL